MPQFGEIWAANEFGGVQPSIAFKVVDSNTDSFSVMWIDRNGFKPTIDVVEQGQMDLSHWCLVNAGNHPEWMNMIASDLWGEDVQYDEAQFNSILNILSCVGGVVFFVMIILMWYRS